MKTYIRRSLTVLLVIGYLHPGNIVAQSKLSATYSADAGMIAQEAPIWVKKCNDFTLTGSGDNTEWQKAEWNLMTKLDSGGKAYLSRFKMMYSPKGIYVLFNGEDNKITTKANKDFGEIYTGDAFEFFVHPDTSVFKYFEYEINALNKELILIISRSGGNGTSWVPFGFENRREMNKMTQLQGGRARQGGKISSWTSEVFIPYDLMDFMPDAPPKSGTVWNANFCRLDYDPGKMIKYSWSPGIRVSFHELDKFRSVKFE